jgi:3-hydroxybutyryl-CoA dehydrogenase
MNIALIGNAKKRAEMLSKISQGNIIKEFDNLSLDFIANQQLIIDIDFDKDPINRWEILSKNSNAYFLLGALHTQLDLLNLTGMQHKVFGFNNMCTFMERNVLEYNSPVGLEIASELKTVLSYTDFLKISNRVGMVSPRVVCMIINEAYFTLQEGTANKEDIDIGMKLGTAYPFGPFEWAHKIGLWDVYSLLLAVKNDTTDERYKICNLLKSEAIKSNLLS